MVRGIRVSAVAFSFLLSILAASPPAVSPDSPGVYATFLGGVRDDGATGLAVDSLGNAFMVGSTDSPDLPVVGGLPWGGGFDGFVAKFDPTGRLAYSTYLGGASTDVATAIAIDPAGNAYVTGHTCSEGFPVTPGTLNTTLGRCWTAFVAKLDEAGTLVYATFLGGAGGYDMGLAIAVDSLGQAVVAGETDSLDFPVTPGGFQATPTNPCDDWNCRDAFLVKLSAAGDRLVYSTYLGGSAWEQADGVAVDSAGAAFVAGRTGSFDFPVTPGAFATNLTYDEASPWQPADAFAAKFDPSGGLAWATFLGGRDLDEALAVRVDAAGHPYVAGNTASNDFPTTPGAYFAARTDNEGGTRLIGFVAELEPTGASLVYSTFLPAVGAQGLAVDAEGAAYVSGRIAFESFEATPGSLGTAYKEGRCDPWSCTDAVLVKVDPSGGSLAYATYLGGEGDEECSCDRFRSKTSVGVDAAGFAYLSGSTSSTDFPVTEGAWDGTFGGRHDAFLVKADVATVPVTLRTEPPGFEVGFEGRNQTSPANFSCARGGFVDVGVRSPQLRDGSHAFVEWSDGGSRVHSIRCDGPMILTARFEQQFTWLLPAILAATILAVLALMMLLRQRRKTRPSRSTEAGTRP